jgi:hypothetical protein
MTLTKFLTYWSLTFAIAFIWAFSVAVALADVKDDMLAKIRKKVGRARLRPVNPLAGRTTAETLAPMAMDEKERWVFHLVSAIAISLRLQVGILVLQDSMDHYLVHFTQGKRMVTYRVDKAWVADAMAGKADQRERIIVAVEQYLRQEFLGQRITPKPAPAAAKPATPAPAGAAPPPPSSAGAAAAAPTPTGVAAPAPASGSAQPGQEMSREERIAAAKAKAEAIRAQRAAGGEPPSPPQDPSKS